MLCKTVQHKNVALQLHKNGKYVVPENASLAGNLKQPYRFIG